MSDTIANILTTIKNAQSVRKASISVPFSRFKFALAKLLAKEGYLSKVEKKKKGSLPVLEIDLKYIDGQPAISGIKKISKLSRRIYTKSKDIKPVISGYGLAIISTPKGLMTSKEAKKENLGGEVICEIY